MATVCRIRKQLECCRTTTLNYFVLRLIIMSELGLYAASIHLCAKSTFPTFHALCYSRLQIDPRIKDFSSVA